MQRLHQGFVCKTEQQVHDKDDCDDDPTDPGEGNQHGEKSAGMIIEAEGQIAPHRLRIVGTTVSLVSVSWSFYGDVRWRWLHQRARRSTERSVQSAPHEKLKQADSQHVCE
jgi:hypothetical protein